MPMTKCKARTEQLFYTTGDTHPFTYSLSINYLLKKEEGRQKGIKTPEILFSGNWIITLQIMKVITSEALK